MLGFLGIEVPGKIVERILVVLAIVFLSAFIMANRHSQNIQNKDGAAKMQNLDQRMNDQGARLESLETKLESINKQEKAPEIVETEPFTDNTYMPAGAFSSILK